MSEIAARFWHCSIPEKTQIEGVRGELSAYSQMHRGRCLCAVLSELLLSNTKGVKKRKEKSVILICHCFLKSICSCSCQQSLLL